MDPQANPQPPIQVAPAPTSSPVAPQGMPSQKPTLPNVPDTWPGAWGAYKYSSKAVRRNLGALIGLVLIYTVLAFLPDILLGKDRTAAELVEFLLTIPTNIALIIVYIAGVQEEKTSFGNALKSGVEPMLYLKYLASIFFLGIAAAVSFLLFIVPFFFVFPRLILTPYFLIGKNMGPLESINASYRSTKGNVGKVWGIIGATLAMSLLMITVIGIPVSIYFLFMYGAVTALLFEYVNRSQPTVDAPTDNMPPANPPTQPQPPAPTPPSPGPQIPTAQPPLVQ